LDAAFETGCVGKRGVEPSRDNWLGLLCGHHPGWQTQYIAIVIIASDAGFGGIEAQTGANAFEAISSDTHALAAATDQNTTGILFFASQHGASRPTSELWVIVFWQQSVIAFVNDFMARTAQELSHLFLELKAVMIGTDE
jgi:hypothetical protein